MQICVAIFGALFQILGVHSFIIPDEVPSLLSVIYSNIPVLKKGTDSRLGWGFRLGDRADFQVLVELGPQIYTQPLANQQDKNTNNKRNTLNTLSNTLWAQRQQDKKNRQQQQEQKSISNSDTEGGKWLDSWRKSMAPKEEEQESESEALEPKPGIAIGEIDAKSVIPDDSQVGFEKLYKSKLKVVTNHGGEEKLEVSTDRAKSTTKKEDALDNVDLD